MTGGRPITLVIGANPELATSLLQALERTVIEVVGVGHDGRTVASLTMTARPKVLVMDLTLPKLDGLGVLYMVRSMPPALQPSVIVLSPTGQEQVIRQVSEAGADYCMVKPIAPDLLLHRIRQFGDDVRPHSQPAHRLTGGDDRPKTHEQGIGNLLVRVGVHEQYRGYGYLHDAVRMVCERENLLGRITKEIYPTIARTHRATVGGVERAIRHAIYAAWKRDEPMLREVFPCCRQEHRPPTNSEFIATLACQMRLGLQAPASSTASQV